VPPYSLNKWLLQSGGEVVRGSASRLRMTKGRKAWRRGRVLFTRCSISILSLSVEYTFYKLLGELVMRNSRSLAGLEDIWIIFTCVCVSKSLHLLRREVRSHRAISRKTLIVAEQLRMRSHATSPATKRRLWRPHALQNTDGNTRPTIPPSVHVTFDLSAPQRPRLPDASLIGLLITGNRAEAFKIFELGLYSDPLTLILHVLFF